MAVAHQPDWPGYVGSPRLANRALGERIWKALSASTIAHATKVLEGADNSAIQRYGDLLSGVPAYVKVDEGARASEAAIERKQSDWLKSRP